MKGASVWKPTIVSLLYEVNVRDFIQKNYTPYEGDDSFLAEPTQNTKDLWEMVLDLSKKEREAGGLCASCLILF